MCARLCETLDRGLLGPFVDGIFQAGILEWVAISFSRDLPDPELEPVSPAPPASVGRCFTTEPPGKAWDCNWIHLNRKPII